MVCNRCSRQHSGVCGIPGYSTMRRPGLARSVSGSRTVRGKPVGKPRRPAKGVLEEVLAVGQVQYQKVVDMLRQLSPDMEVYGELIDREAKLASVIQQLGGQIANRR